MDFVAAQTRYQQLEADRRAGRITDAAYREALNAIRITDAQGRLWMMQEQTGQWHVYDGSRWLPATPPTPVAPPPAPVAPVAAPTPKSRKTGSYLLIWVILWAIIGVAAYLYKGREEPTILYGVAAAAVLSLILMLTSLAGSWSGQIVELRRVREGEDDSEVLYAFVRQPKGRLRKERAASDWRVGDRLEKRKGEAWVRKV